MLMLSIIGLVVLVGLVGIGAYWIVNNVTVKKDDENAK
jgi:hypothetical protein